MSVTETSIREQAREYLHQVAHHDDTNYGNVYVIDGARIDAETALDMAELALLTQKPIATAFPGVSVAQALDLARRVREIENRLLPLEPRKNIPTGRSAAKGGSGEDPAA